MLPSYCVDFFGREYVPGEKPSNHRRGEIIAGEVRYELTVCATRAKTRIKNPIFCHFEK